MPPKTVVELKEKIWMVLDLAH